MSQDNHPQPGLVFHNPKPSEKGERFVMRIEARTDDKPGWFNNPADLMQWLSSHPHICSVKLLEVGPPPKPKKKDKNEGMKSK